LAQPQPDAAVGSAPGAIYLSSGGAEPGASPGSLPAATLGLVSSGGGKADPVNVAGAIIEARNAGAKAAWERLKGEPGGVEEFQKQFAEWRIQNGTIVRDMTDEELSLSGVPQLNELAAAAVRSAEELKRYQARVADNPAFGSTAKLAPYSREAHEEAMLRFMRVEGITAMSPEQYYNQMGSAAEQGQRGKSESFGSGQGETSLAMDRTTRSRTAGSRNAST
jgi:hypothetical protein